MELCGERGEEAAQCSDKTSHLHFVYNILDFDKTSHLRYFVYNILDFDKTSHLRYFIHNILDFVLSIGSLIIVFVKRGDEASEVFTYFCLWHSGKTSTSGIAKKASLP